MKRDKSYFVCEHAAVVTQVLLVIAGLRCNECEYTYYNLDRSNPAGCTSCNCNPFGATDQYCDPHIGQCVCKALVQGQQCGECVDGYYDFNNGCMACDCDQDGTVAGTVCDKESGQCLCIQHANGTKCNECKEGYYNLGGDVDTGCVPCLCYVPGSADSPPRCHMTTGQCTCKANVESRTCNQCVANTFNLTMSNKDGCQSCGCDVTGTVISDIADQSQLSCNQNTGQCTCLTNRYGRTCDNCNKGGLFSYTSVGNLCYLIQWLHTNFRQYGYEI